MASILHKRKTADPSASDLTVGELAINTQDGGVFTKTDGGSVVEIGSTGGSADNTSTFTTTANNSTDETVYPVFVDGTSGNQGAEVDTGLTYNPSTGVLTTTSVTGNLTGNVTGNASGTAATVTGAAQTNITSVGTLTGLTVAGDVTFNDSSPIDVTFGSSTTGMIWNEEYSRLRLMDNVKIVFGNSSDGAIKHNGTNEWLFQDYGAVMKFDEAEAGSIQFVHVSETMAKFNTDGSCELYHDDSKKIETTATGASITGLMSATTIDGAAGDNLSLDFGSVA